MFEGCIPSEARNSEDILNLKLLKSNPVILFRKDLNSLVKILLCIPRKNRMIPGIEGKCWTGAMESRITF
jgi:hypothetical protein